MSQIIDTLKASSKQRRDAPILSRMPGLGRIEHVTCRLSPESHVLVPGSRPSPVHERFHLLDHRLRSIRQARSLSSLLITSSVPKEGKTLTSINLSIVLAGSKQSVLLIDGDARRPSTGRTLGIDPRPGLLECLQEKGTLSELTIYLPDLGIYHLAAGDTSVNVGELLQRPTARSVLAEASASFDWVIIDSPPITPFADAICLSTLTDGTLMVARCGVTTNSALKRSIEALDEKAYLAGVILNGCNDRKRQSYYGYYRA